VLSRIFGPKREEVAGGWGILHNEELYNLYSSPNIIKIKSRRMRIICTIAVIRRRGRWEVVLLENTMGRCGLDSSGSS
jgi:hypothetical protein